jgi:ubiquinone/menaquinone biosynthesis C-methylase UbiE
MASKGLRERLKPRIQDFMMRFMDELRPQTVGAAGGKVLEVGFGTGRNLAHYGARVEKLIGLDPLNTEGVRAVEERIARASFPVERTFLTSDDRLPFQEASFDCIITTWTLCSIPDPGKALVEMRRVLKPGGHYLFIEHGRSPRPSTERWQDRINPIWRRLMDGCNINRPIDRLVEDAGFSLVSLDRFQHKGPQLLAYMYRGVATSG